MWVWLLPPALGLITALVVLFLPGVSADMGLFGSVALAVFGLLAVTVIGSIYLISFDKDHDQEIPEPGTPLTAACEASSLVPSARSAGADVGTLREPLMHPGRGRIPLDSSPTTAAAYRSVPSRQSRQMSG